MNKETNISDYQDERPNARAMEERPNWAPRPRLEDYRDKYAPFFTFERSDGILQVQMHHEGGGAQYGYPLHSAWPQLWTDIGNDLDNEVLIFSGTGDKWIADFDMELAEKPLTELPEDVYFDHLFTDQMKVLESLIFNIDIPTIGCINGPGMHTEFALLCDITLVADHAVIFDPHFGHGLVPGDGQGLAFQTLMGPKRAAYHMYLGKEIGAAEAVELGLANEHMPLDALLPRAWEIARQAGTEAERFADADPAQTSVFFLDGEEHRRRRADLARYFTPRAIEQRYLPVMEATTDRVLGEFRKAGRARLDLMSFQLAAEVAAEVVGLTETDPIAMARRIRKVIETTGRQGVTGWRKFLFRTAGVAHSLNFWLSDIRPAVKARRSSPREDILSHLAGQGGSALSIYIECVSYGTGGMLTTREFIVMSAWHLLEDDTLREQFLNGGSEVQLAILDEILRLKPVSGMIQHSRAAPGGGGKDLIAIDVRAANTDEAVAGPEPLSIDPERSKRQKMTANWMSFGDGPHRCPGAQIALQETRLFLDRLMRVPGIRLAEVPPFGWWDTISSYELRGAVVECDG